MSNNDNQYLLDQIQILLIANNAKDQQVRKLRAEKQAPNDNYPPRLDEETLKQTILEQNQMIVDLNEKLEDSGDQCLLNKITSLQDRNKVQMDTIMKQEREMCKLEKKLESEKCYHAKVVHDTKKNAEHQVWHVKAQMKTEREIHEAHCDAVAEYRNELKAELHTAKQERDNLLRRVEELKGARQTDREIHEADCDAFIEQRDELEAELHTAKQERYNLLLRVEELKGEMAGLRSSGEKKAKFYRELWGAANKQARNVEKEAKATIWELEQELEKLSTK